MFQRASKLFKATTQQECCLPRTRIADALQYARSETMKAMCQSLCCVGQEDGSIDIGNHLSPGVFHGSMGANTITSYKIVSTEASSGGGGWNLSGGSNTEEIEEGLVACNGVAYWLQTDREGMASVVYGKFSLDKTRPGQLVFRGTYVSLPLDTNHGKVKLKMVSETDDLNEMFESSFSSLFSIDFNISQRSMNISQRSMNTSQRSMTPSHGSLEVNDSFDKSWSPPDMFVADPSCQVGDIKDPLQIQMDDGTTAAPPVDKPWSPPDMFVADPSCYVGDIEDPLQIEMDDETTAAPPVITPPTPRKKKKSKKNGVSSSPKSPKPKKEKIETTTSSNNGETETKKKKKIKKKKVNSDDPATGP